MSRGRGTDQSIEERRLRPVEENDAVGTYLEDLFEGGVEAILVSLPVLIWFIRQGQIELTFIGVMALSALGFAIGTLRNERFEPGVGWPALTIPLVALRLAYYNVALWAAVEVGRALVARPLFPIRWAREPVIVPALIAMLAAGAFALAFPYVANAVSGVVGGEP